MDLSVNEFLGLVYLVGVLITSYLSIKSMLNLYGLKKFHNFDLLSKPGIKRYVILKPILWPYFFVTEKSPSERLSELFFKNYGEEGHTYFGNQGLKNFLNDLFKGKGRYRNCLVKSLYWDIDKNSPHWIEFKKIFKNEKFYAHIIYTKIKDKYLLRVIWQKNKDPFSPESISRFELDQGEKLTKLEFKTRLRQINISEANKLCD